MGKKTDLHGTVSSGQPADGEAAKRGAVEFEPGQVVIIRSMPSSCGAVIAALPGNPENRFKVFIDGQAEVFYASQLQAKDLEEEHADLVSCEEFHACLTALQIRCPSLSTLYSLNAARVDFIPYQFRPVLRFIRSDRPRLLIADGVGVGKTIEAGLILRELQARRDVRSVLIVCPRPLVTECKWQNEMKRFGERFTHLDGDTLRYCLNEMDLDGTWPEQHQRSIVPYSLFDETLLYGSPAGSKRKQRRGLLQLDPPPRFDFVIVDEAHHIRNPSTYSHKAVKFFCDHAEAVVFLTATPIQLGSMDLFVLLNTLRPDLIVDQESFEHMTKPNPFINKAVAAVRANQPGWQAAALEALDQAAATSWGQAILRRRPDFTQVRSKLLSGETSNDERVRTISDIEAMHTLSGIINRTRRRDIGNFTVRKPETVLVPFTAPQQHLHDELLRIQAVTFERLHNRPDVKFMMTTIRRQAASCIHGLTPFLEDILNRHMDKLSWGEIDDTRELEGDAVAAIQDQIRKLLEAARAMGTDDPKLQALCKIIRDKQRLPNNKIMLFSSFRHTLRYLFDHLSKDGVRVGMVHGGTADEERVALRRRFEMPRDEADGLDLLLFSEIGCEGLDYQFCDCMVNYDLPWNPMRIEQRIGRIDRRGQKSDTVAIVNMITPGTVDADIYDRCLLRIGVFNSALGGGEEILGDISRGIKNIAESYDLRDGERRQKLEQLADNKIRLMQEQDALEQKQVELFGLRLPEEQMNREIADAASFWLTPISIRRLVTLYLQRLCGKDQEFFLGERSLRTLRLSQEARAALLGAFRQLPRQSTAVYREWERWLKDGDQHLQVTFEAACAREHLEAAFITPIHPLVRQAALFVESQRPIVTSLAAVSTDVPQGTHKFAVYQWRFHGIREDLVIKPIASSAMVTKQIGSVLEGAVDGPTKIPSGLDADGWEDLDGLHYELWTKARAGHQQRTKELAAHRRESLSTSHQARRALLEEQLASATNEKIQRMRQSQISAAEADFERHIQALETAIEQSDVMARPVAYGVVDVSGGPSDAD